MSTRIEGIVDRLADADTFDSISWILGSGVVTNYAESIIDDHLKANLDFQSKAGLAVTVERIRTGNHKCIFCEKREGKYTYPDVPDGFWQRHLECKCFIEYDNGSVRQKLGGRGKKWEIISEETLGERKRVGMEKPTAKVLEARKIVGLDPQNKLAQGIGAEHYENMQTMVDASENETVKRMWNTNARRVDVASTTEKGREHAFRGSIYIDLEKNAKGSMHYMPYETIFHESGHAIDAIFAPLGDMPAMHFSYSYKRGAFRDTIVEEANAIVNNKAKEIKSLFAKEDWAALHEIGAISDFDWSIYENTGNWLFGDVPKYSKAKAYAAVSKDLKSMSAHQGGDVSDIMEGATNARAQGTMGHGATYWKQRKEALPTEAFAEFTSATFSNPESLETIKKWFPKSYKMYEEMCEAILNGGV